MIPFVFVSSVALMPEAVHATCTQTLAEYIRIGNSMAVFTSLFGSVSIVACFCVVIIIIAYQKERISMRERIILGLMIANIMYSAANTVPISFGNPHTCIYGVTQQERMWTRGVWLFGKYWIVSYEIVIMLASLTALTKGVTSFSAFMEASAHGVCFFTGAIAFAVWTSLTIANVRERDYLLEQQQNDLNGDDTYSENLGEYNNYLAWMLRIWLIPLCVALLMWMVSRWKYHQLCEEIRWKIDEQRNQNHQELWSVQVRSRLLELQAEACAEIMKPLEPYIVVFVVFAIPAIVMTTNYCINISSITTGNAYCLVPCEMVLALRSLATACVYFIDASNRSQLRNFPATLRRLRQRLQCCCGAGCCCVQTSTLQGKISPESGVQKRVAFSSALDVHLLGDDSVEDWP